MKILTILLNFILKHLILLIYFGCFFGTYFCFNPGSALAHVPHDVVDSVEVSPTYDRDKMVLVVARNTLYRSTDGGASWKTLVRGLDNKYLFSSIAISPSFNTDQTIFIASNGDGIYKSIDKGNSWFHANYGIDNLHIGIICTSPNYYLDETILAASSESGLFRSNNGGESWSKIKDIKSLITAMAFIPGRKGHVLLGDNHGNVFLSTNEGVSWKRLKNLGNQAIRAIAVSPKYSLDGTYFVATEAGFWSKGSLYRTDAYGSSFLKLKLPELTNSDRGITSLVVSPNYENDGSLFFTSWRQAAYRSSDRGETWKIYHKGITSVSESKSGKPIPDFKRITIANDSHFTIFLAAFDGLFKSIDSGESWNEMETVQLGTIIGLDLASNSHALINTYGSGAYLTDNQGSNWKVLNQGMQSIRGLDISFSPDYLSDRSLFVGARLGLSLGKSNFAKSVNNGNNWQKAILTDKGQNWLTTYMVSIPWIPNRVRSTLFGSGFDPMVIAVSPNFVADRTIYVGGVRGQIFKSEDGGDTFFTIYKGGFRGAVTSMVISPNFINDNTLYAALGNFDISKKETRLGPFKINTNDCLIKSTDAGQTWQSIDSGLPINLGAGIRLAISPNYQEDKTIFAATANGLYKMSPGRDSWKKIRSSVYGSDSFIEAVALSPNYGEDGQMILSVRGKGLYVSFDKAQTFKPIGTNLIQNNHSFSNLRGFPVSSMSIQFSPFYSTDQTIFGVTSENVFLSQDGGYTWRKLSRPIRYEDNIRLGILSFQESKNWKLSYGDEYSFSSVTSSSRTGSKVVFRFVGTGVRVIGTQGNDQGIAKVYVDGKYQGEIDQFNSQNKFNVVSYSINNLDNSPHRLVVEVTGRRNKKSKGTRIDIDAFDISR